MRFKKSLSVVLAFSMLILSAVSTAGSANAVEIETQDKPQSSSIAQQPSSDVPTTDYGLCEDAADGAILHAFCWSFQTIKNNMEDIANAGYTVIQTPPAHTFNSTYNNGKLMGNNPNNGEDGAWWWIYQAVELTPNNDLGTAADYAAMCSEADKYGIKIITDVIANHTATDLTKINENYWLKSGKSQLEDLYHTTWTNTITNHNDRYQSTYYSLQSLPDINTEDEQYQAYFVEFCNQLIALGCDGFRYDAAKHVATNRDLQSADAGHCFWDAAVGQKTVQNYQNEYVKLGVQNKTSLSDPDVKINDTSDDLFIYGEILQDGNKYTSGTYNGQYIIPYSEYDDYMGITLSQYGHTLRNAIKNKSFSKDTLRDWSTYGYDESQPMVTWVEYDTYSNTDHESCWITDQQIRLGWAVIAARDKGTPLFFSRPDGSNAAEGNYWGNNVFGAKGNDQFKDPEVVAVNKFRNKMASYKKQGINVSEDLKNINNSQVLQIDRGTKGTCIINIGSRDYDIDTVTNLAVGNYIDTVSGTLFKVYKNGANNYIKGHIFANKSAVIYEPVLGDLSVTFSGDKVFDNTLSASLTSSGLSNTSYTISVEGEPIETESFTNGQSVTIGNNLNATYSSKEILLTVQGTNGDDVLLKSCYSLVKQSPNDKVTVYFDNTSYNWNTVNAYVYKDGLENGAWPGVQLTETLPNNSNIYKYDIPYELRNGQIIFAKSKSDNVNRYPANNEPGMYINGSSKIFSANYSFEEYIPQEIKADGNQDVSSYNYVYFFNQTGWTDGSICVSLWNDTLGENNGIRNKGMCYNEDLHCYYLKYPADANFDKVKFTDSAKDSNVTSTEVLTAGKVYVPFKNSVYKINLSDIYEHKVYFDNTTTGWSKVNAYMWRGIDNVTLENNAWPGFAMKKESDSNIYSLTYYYPQILGTDTNYQNIIFTNKPSGSYQTNDLTIQASDEYVYKPANQQGTSGSWSSVTSNQSVTVTLKYYDYSVLASNASSANQSGNAQYSERSISKKYTVTDGSVKNAVNQAVTEFNMQNQYDGYFFRASEFEYIKTIASAADTERLGSDITLAQAINPSYFCYQTKAFSGSHTKIEDLSAEQSKEKWVTYNKVTGSGANITRTEVQAKDVKSDLSNINEIVVWGYSQPTEYEVKFHYPKSDQAPTEIKDSGLYTRSDYTITDTLKCYYNQLINPNEDNPAPAVFVPTGYEFDGWYLVDFSSNGGYVKVTDEAFFNCRITSNLELYAVFRETGKNAKASVSAMSNGVDVFTTGSADDNTQATKYRLNTLMAANGIENSSIEQVGVVYVKATKKSQHTYSDINAIKGTLETELAKTTPSSTVTYSGSEAAVSYYKYTKSQAQLTSKNRLQFVLTLGDTTAENKDVLAFTAYKSGDAWTLSDNCVVYKGDTASMVYSQAQIEAVN